MKYTEVNFETKWTIQNKLYESHMTILSFPVRFVV